MNTSKLFFFMVLCSTFTFAQVGVNIPSGSTVDPSAAFEIQSGSSKKGLLTPRMTTAERLSIVTPADGLIVYDTEIGSFYYYKSAKAAIAGPPATPASLAAWVKISNDVNGRLNFKRIKSTDVLATVLAEELTNGGNSKYQLKTNTLYEINGTVVFDKPIDLNKAYIQGLDSGDDRIVAAGNIFDGNTGGTIKGLTLISSAKVFNITGTTKNENLIFRDCIVANSASVGTIDNMGLVFLSIVQFSANTTGVTYSNINQLLLSNLGWFGNNKGTFEKLTGTFGLVQKQGGFSDVTDAASTFAFDVSGNPTITGDAVLESVVFTGDSTGAKYVNKYTTGSYTGYNFNNSWNVRSTGIPNETDGDASGTFILNYVVGNGISINPTTTPTLINGVSEGANLFRFSTNNLSRLTYLGKKKRIVSISGSMSFQAPGIATYVIYLAKKGVVSQNKFFGRSNNSNDIVTIPIDGTLELNTGDYVEVYIEKYSGATGNVLIPNMTLSIK